MIVMKYSLLLALLSTGAMGAAGATPPKSLSIERVTFSQYEDGEGVSPDYGFVPGETIFFSFHVGGFRYVEDDNEKRELAVDYTIDAKDPSGIPIIETQRGKVNTELVPEDKNWTPKVRAQILIPPYAPGGSYKITIYVKDKVANTDMVKDVEFTVRGPKPEPSDSLVIRRVRFYRNEEDTKPLTTAAYSGGDPVWIRFDIAGFKLADKNRFDVGYGFAILRANGEQLFAQPEAADEADESFYPRRIIPATFSISLQKGIAPGQYMVLVTAHDKIGGQTCEARQSFSVE